MIQSRDKLFLKLLTAGEELGRCDGLVLVWLLDGRPWQSRVVKIACNVAGQREGRVGDTLLSELPSLLREWFGPDAGLTNATIQFLPAGWSKRNSSCITLFTTQRCARVFPDC